MPAYSEMFPWSSHFGHYHFFEQRMAEHSHVRAVRTAAQLGLYCVTRTSGEELVVFICDCYGFGLAEYDEAIANLGRPDVIIINSNWCHYTPTVKRHCRGQKVGVFTIGEFMAALNRPKFWEYPTKHQIEQFTENGWL